MTQPRRDSHADLPVINLTLNVRGLVTQEAIDLINEKVAEAIALALDEARRMPSDLKQ